MLLKLKKTSILNSKKNWALGSKGFFFLGPRVIFGLEGVNRGDKQCYMRTFRVLAARSNWGPFIVQLHNFS